MNNEFSFANFVSESALDFPRNSLDPTVFQFQDGLKPILSPKIKVQIMEDITKIQQLLTVNQFYIIGSILTRNYSPRSDIDVNIEIFGEDLDDDLVYGRTLTVLKEMNGRLANGTTHPINYYIIKAGKFDLTRTEGAYDVESEKWLKEPKFFSINISSYISNFENLVQNVDLTAAALRRDIIDYEELKQFSKDEIKNIKHIIKNKLYEITNSISYLIDVKNNLRKVRKYSYDRPMTPSEISEFSSKNYIPHNVVYKLFQKYYYWDFINKLEEIAGSEEGIKDSDIDQIKKAEKEFWGVSESFADFSNKDVLEEKIRPVKLKKIDWKNPKAVRSHLHNTNRGLNRKTMRQVPKSQTALGRHASWRNLGTSKKVVDIAKKASSGIWRLTGLQVKEISQKYHFYPPNERHHLKHLGNTGIMIWRKKKGLFFLIKTGLKPKI